MYNVFPTSLTSSNSRGGSSGDEPIARTSRNPKDAGVTRKLTRSCAECRRRRIRCDSTDPPCGQCQWYKVPELCHYPTRRKRNVPSQESFAAVSMSLEKANRVLENLFPPNSSLDSLSTLSRDELIALVTSRPHESDESFLTEAMEEALQYLEPSPERNFGFDESCRYLDRSSKIADEVNALSLSLDSNSSHSGISSITAVLQVMAYISPEFKALIHNHQGTVSEPTITRDYKASPSQTDELALINAFFSHIHCITPMVDEADFRAKYARGDDQRSPWLALLNMVLTMGSLATSEPDEKSHSIFFHRAYQHLTLESLGHGHLENVQALGLLGGWYCHYLNQPNLANVLMGAALRMASAMGLHREQACAKNPLSGSSSHASTEIRIRVWWSLFCLDAWASFSLGRPSFGRWDAETVTVKLPEALSHSDFASVSLRASVEFCKIGTTIQDQFARHPVMSCRDLLAFDARLLRWYEDLPAVLKRSGTCPRGLLAARGWIKARYLNLRLVIHRPRLLISTLQRTPTKNLLPDEREIIERCRAIASEIIADVQRDWFPVQQIVRNSVWFLFQGCLVSLLGLFAEPHHILRESWSDDVETSLALLGEMSSWSLVVNRTREVVASMYEASKRYPSSHQSVIPMEIPVECSRNAWDLDPIWDDTEWGSVQGFNGFGFDATELAGFGDGSLEAAQNNYEVPY